METDVPCSFSNLSIEILIFHEIIGNSVAILKNQMDHKVLKQSGASRVLYNHHVLL